MESPLLITGGYDSYIYIWHADTGEVYKKILHNDCHINSIEISPNYTNFAVAENPLVRFYDIYACGGDNSHPIVTYEGHTNNVTSIGYEKDSQYIFTSSEDSTAKIWDLRTTGYQLYYDNNFSPIYSACLIPNNETVLLFSDSKGYVNFWDIRANKICNTLTAEAGIGINNICVSEDGEILCACSHTGTLHLWHLSNVSDCNYNNEKNSIVLDSLNEYSNKHGNNIHLNQQQMNDRNNDGNNYENCSYDSVKNNYTVFRQYNNKKNNNGGDKSNCYNSSYINYNNFNNKNKKNNIFITENIKQMVPHHGNYVLKCRFSVSGEYLATASSDGMCILWKKHLDGFLKENTLRGHERWVWDVRFSSDGAYVLTASSDRTCKLWDVYTANKLLDYVAHQSAVTSICLLDVPLDKINEEKCFPFLNKNSIKSDDE